MLPINIRPTAIDPNVGGAAPPAFDPSVTAPSEGPCVPWVTIADVRACGLAEADADDAAVTFGIALASRVLWASSGRRYGLCRKILRPCYEGDHSFGFHGVSDHRFPDAYDEILHHSPWRRGYGHTGHGYSKGNICSCFLDMLELPGPIAAVEAITFNGEILDPRLYAIKTAGFLKRRALVRTDGESWWCCNDLTRDPCAANPLQVQGNPDCGDEWVNEYRLANDLAIVVDQSPGCPTDITGPCQTVSGVPIVGPLSTCFANLTLIPPQVQTTASGGTESIAWSESSPGVFDVVITNTSDVPWINAIATCLATVGQVARLDLNGAGPLGLSFYTDAASAVVDLGTQVTFTYTTTTATAAAAACQPGGFATQMIDTVAFLAANPFFAQLLNVPAVAQLVTCYGVSFSHTSVGAITNDNDCGEDPDDLEASDPDCPAWQVAYWQGRSVPLEGQGVGALLAEQFARARCGGECDKNLTAGLKKIARRGTTREYESSAELRKAGGLTGMMLVDHWLQSVNPHGLKRRATVTRADSPEHRRLWSWVKTGWTP